MFNTIFQQSESCTQQPTVFLSDEEIIDYTRCSDNPSESTVEFQTLVFHVLSLSENSLTIPIASVLSKIYSQP